MRVYFHEAIIPKNSYKYLWKNEINIRMDEKAQLRFLKDKI